MREAIVIVALALGSAPALAATPQEFLERYAGEAKAASAAFAGFSAARGEQFFRAERRRPDGALASCAGCHTADPRQPGLTRANKRIEPLAPAASRARFSDAAQVEKWFRRNCDDVLGRACSAAEKGDVLAWLLTLK